MLVTLCNGLYYLSAAICRLVVGFTVFIICWVLYDYMKVFPNHPYRPGDIAGLYSPENNLFGIRVRGLAGNAQ